MEKKKFERLKKREKRKKNKAIVQNHRTIGSCDRINWSVYE